MAKYPKLMLITQKYEVKLKEKMHKVQLLEKCQQLVGMASWDLIRAKRIIFWRFLAIFS